MRFGPHPTPSTPSQTLSYGQYREALLGGCGKHPSIARTSLQDNSILRNDVLDATSKTLQNSVKRKRKREV